MLAVRDLIDAVEEDRDPEASIHDALTATEMIVGLFESHRQGGARVPFPWPSATTPGWALKTGFTNAALGPSDWL